MAIYKPQKALTVNEKEIYPLTSADQVIMDDGSRLNAAINKFIVPSYSASDYGKLLACSEDGLQWVESLSELNSAEESEY